MSHESLGRDQWSNDQIKEIYFLTDPEFTSAPPSFGSKKIHIRFQKQFLVEGIRKDKIRSGVI